MWYRNGFFKYSTGLILMLLIIFLIGQLGFILTPTKNALMVVAFPLIVTLLFYYLLRPLVRFLIKLGLTKVPSILVSFLITIVLLVLFGTLAGNTIINEFNQFSKELPEILNSAEKTITELINSGNLDFLLTDEVISRASNFMEKTIPFIGRGIFSGIASAISIVTGLLLVPFILFYFLKDDTMFAKQASSLPPKKFRDETMDILVDVDQTLSSYITGQAMVSLVVGILMYFGYLIIGLKYALVLALFSMLTAIIPFIGPIIGVLPALLIGLSYDFSIIVKIFILVAIVQQLEGNLITPQIMGKRINTHPVTVIIVLLLSASLFGFAGILLAIPSYAVLKVLIKNALEIYRIIKRENTDTHELKPHQLRYWLRKLPHKETAETHSTEGVSVEVGEEPLESGDGLLIKVGKATVEVKPGFNPSLLSDIIRILKELC